MGNITQKETLNHLKIYWDKNYNAVRKNDCIYSFLTLSILFSQLFFVSLHKKKKMENKEIIYFDLNNWFSGRDYPEDEKFGKWGCDMQFSNDDWCKENKLCVVWGTIDMSFNWLIAAPKEWVEENCPDLLSDKTYTYTTITMKWGDNGEEITEKNEYTKAYKDFVYTPNSFGDVYGRFDLLFPKYSEENFGSKRIDLEKWYEDENDDDDYKIGG